MHVHIFLNPVLLLNPYENLLFTFPRSNGGQQIVFNHAHKLNQDQLLDLDVRAQLKGQAADSYCFDLDAQMD